MYRVLELLRRQTDYISGEKIGQHLQISRAAVWKNIQKLREQGYEIEAVSNRGYRLQNPETMYNEREILSGMKTKIMGQVVEFHKEIDTTNNRAKTLAYEGAKEGTLVIAEQQSAGRGRRGKHWISPVGTGVWMSLILRPNVAPSQCSVLTLLCGLAVADALSEETGMEPQIKWPNDILINGKKVVGILTEMDCEMTQVNFIIPGIGINVNTTEFPPELSDIATSLYLETGKTISRKKIVQAVMEKIEHYYDIFLKEGFSPLLSQYRNRCMTLHQEVEVLSKEPFFAKAIDITPEGELIVERLSDGVQEVVYSGEVSIRRR